MTFQPPFPCVVTGATGFLGNALVRRLLADGHTVHAVVREPFVPRRLPAGAEPVAYDGTAATFCALLEKLRNVGTPTIFHLAADYGGGNIAGDRVQAIIVGNTVLPIQLAEACRIVLRNGQDPTRFINVGSYWQYDRHGAYKPNTLYAAAKQAAQDMLAYYAAEEGLRVVTLVMFDLFGPGDSREKLIPQLLRAARDDQRIETSPGWQKIDFVHVEDAVDALLAGERYLREAPTSNDHPRFAVNTGRQVTLREMVAVLNSIVGRPVDVAWGLKCYPSHQIMEPVSSLPRLPNWTPRRTLEQGLTEAWQELSAAKPQE